MKINKIAMKVWLFSILNKNIIYVTNFIFQSPADFPFVQANLYRENLLNATVIDDFAPWQYANRHQYTQFDHALFVTRYIHLKS